jgi:hypothetical protein
MSYHTANLEARAFDRWLTLSEKAAHKAAIEANDAFAAAMTNAIKHGKVTVAIGTFVDNRPLVGAPIRGYAPVSSCGSPAAMCIEEGEAR